jgi:nucleotide-binding universal stress UspA family protein
MKNLLVPTDFSAEAHNAFEVALQLAKRTGGHVTLLHVVDLPGAAGVSSSGTIVSSSGLNDVFALKLLQITKHRMYDLMREAERVAPEVAVQDIIHTDVLDDAILEVIRDRHIDLVVMGGHVHRPGEHIFTDSHTERIVRLAPCPVLTVKHPSPNFDVHHIVFASDFSPEASRALPSLRQIQDTFPEATLHLLDIEPSLSRHEAALERIHAFARQHQLTQYHADVFDAPKPSTGISRFAEQAHADLVVMLTHGRTGLRHWLQGSIAESVAVQTAAPVLTFHAPVD